MNTQHKNQQPFQPIAIIGIGAMFPDSKNPEALWGHIVHGRDLIKDIPSTHWLIEDYFSPTPGLQDKTYCKRGGFLNPTEFDPVEFGIPPHIIPAIDTAQLLALIVAKAVLNDATRGLFSQMDLSRVSVILGASPLEAIQYSSSRLQRPIWTHALRESGLSETIIATVCDRIENSYTPWQENTFPGLLGNVIAGRIANRFNLGGSNYITDAACAGSMAAFSAAINELQLGLADWVITGGVDAMNDIHMFMCFSKTGALSIANDCKPFSADADGTILGEGLAMFALKRLADAERDADDIYAVVTGLGTSSDGRSKSIYAPDAKGQALALSRAYQSANINPSTIELIEAHGTGTQAGDLAEFQSLKAVFIKDKNTRQQSCALGSIKSQIGHTKAAAGSAGVLKSILALLHKTLPPTIKVEQPNPAFRIEQSPFYLNTEARPWIRGHKHPRRAGVSSFGFGGSNFHVVLEEYSQKNKKPGRFRMLASELIVFSEKNTSGVLQKASMLKARLHETSLVDAAKESQCLFEGEHPARLAIVAETIEDLRNKLALALQMILSAPDKRLSLDQGIYFNPSAISSTTALMFNGLGTESMHMGRSLIMAFDDAMSAWEEHADEFVESSHPLHDVIFPHAVFQESERTVLQQRCHEPKWALSGLAVHASMHLKLLKRVGIESNLLFGHGFGECFALMAAGVMDCSSVMRFAYQYGQKLADIPLLGTFIEIIYPVTDLHNVLTLQSFNVTMVSTNSVCHTVWYCPSDELLPFQRYLDGQKIIHHRMHQKSLHCLAHHRLMNPSLQNLVDALPASSAKKTVLHSVSGRAYSNDRKKIHHTLLQSFGQPVHFKAQIERAYEKGARVFIEVGAPGRLAYYVTQTLRDRPHEVVALAEAGRDDVTSFWRGLGALLAAGVDLDVQSLWQGFMRPQQEKKSVHHSVSLTGANYGKPYPEKMGRPKAKSRLGLGPTKIFSEGEKTMTEQSPPVLQLLHELQKQLVDVHANYQRAMTDSHLAFIQAMNQLGAHIPSLPTGGSAPPPEPFIATHAPTLPPIFQAPPVAERVAPPQRAEDLEQILIETLAEKTGYPAKMINMDMAIEADLGIDSIKRIEILAALSAKFSYLPTINAEELSTLYTLNDILNYLKHHKTLQPA